MSPASNTPSIRYLDEAWPERWFLPHADRLPMRLRGLPWLRKFYWTQEELDEIHARAKAVADRLGL